MLYFLSKGDKRKMSDSCFNYVIIRWSREGTFSHASLFVVNVCEIYQNTHDITHIYTYTWRQFCGLRDLKF